MLVRSIYYRIAHKDGIAIVAGVAYDRVERFATGIQMRGLDAVALELNITDGASIEKVVGEVKLKYRRVNAAANNAHPRGMNYGLALEAIDYEELRKILSLHLGGHFLTSQKFASGFLTQGRGNIVELVSNYMKEQT